ncbi:MAG: site-specific integrase [Candidatus Methanomethylophilaceae archaeon]|nr:site-specific integrase [Candidatus Methanomethylophilaceae archaeon]
MTVEDIRAFIQYRWDTGVSHSEMMHEITSMKSLFGFMGTNVFQEFLYRYPQMKAHKTRNMLPSLQEDEVQRIITFGSAVPTSDWQRIRAYALVSFAICSGLRSKEMRLCNVEDVTIGPDGFWLVKVMHPKGEGTYGKVRTVIMNRDCIPIMERYLEARKEYVIRTKNPSRALFIGNRGPEEHLQGNTLRKMKDIVANETGLDFDLRTCRRTFGQRLVDKGVDIESVSKVMGHTNPVITSEVYCCKQEDAAIETIRSMYEGA